MSQVEVEVLKSVKVSDDGITSRWIIAGKTDTIPDAALAGLEAEGYVALPGSGVERTAATPLETKAFKVEETTAGSISRGAGRADNGVSKAKAAELGLAAISSSSEQG